MRSEWPTPRKALVNVEVVVRIGRPEKLAEKSTAAGLVEVPKNVADLVHDKPLRHEARRVTAKEEEGASVSVDEI